QVTDADPVLQGDDVDSGDDAVGPPRQGGAIGLGRELEHRDLAVLDRGGLVDTLIGVDECGVLVAVHLKIAFPAHIRASSRCVSARLSSRPESISPAMNFAAS